MCEKLLKLFLFYAIKAIAVVQGKGLLMMVKLLSSSYIAYFIEDEETWITLKMLVGEFKPKQKQNRKGKLRIFEIERLWILVWKEILFKSFHIGFKKI